VGCYPSQLYEENFKGKTPPMISRDELMHHRLQAWLRENQSEDLTYLGYYGDTFGMLKHWYLIAGEHEVSVDCIEGLDLVEDESDSL